MAAGPVRRGDRAILGLVPVGEENAVTARLLWQVNRVGAVATVKYKLNNALLEAGGISLPALRSLPWGPTSAIFISARARDRRTLIRPDTASADRRRAAEMEIVERPAQRISVSWR